MASINLYKIDANKAQMCLKDLAASNMNLKATRLFTREVEEKEYEFGVTLYLEQPFQSDEGISWNWLLKEFDKEPFNAYKSPKAILLIEETVQIHPCVKLKYIPESN